MTVLIERRKLSKVVFYASLIAANFFYLSIYLYAVASGHALGPVVLILYSTTVVILAIAYMAREPGVFIASLTPIALSAIAVPFYLHLSPVNVITVLALEALCVLGVLSALQRHAQLAESIAVESAARVKAEEQNAVK